MNRLERWLRVNYAGVMSMITMLILGAVLLLVVSQGANSQKLLDDNKRLLQSQTQLLENQNSILDAIKTLAEDTKITSQEKTDTIICMLQVEIEERTTDVLEDCREKATNGDPVSDPAPSQEADASPKE